MQVQSATARHAGADAQLQAGARRLLEEKDSDSNVRSCRSSSLCCSRSMNTCNAERLLLLNLYFC